MFCNAAIFSRFTFFNEDLILYIKNPPSKYQAAFMKKQKEDFYYSFTEGSGIQYIIQNKEITVVANL
jgi:hypothetical protein